MTRITVLIHQPLANRLFTAVDRERLNQLGEVTWYDGDEPPSYDQAKALLADSEIALGSWGTPNPGKLGLLAACPKLALWEHVAGSVKHFFTDEFKSSGIVAASCKGAIGDAVAEYVIGQMIIGLRHVIPNALNNRTGPTPQPSGLKVLAGSTVGIVGASVVGRETIRLLKFMNANVRVFDPFCSDTDAAEMGAEKFDDLVEMMADLDVLTIHTPLLEATKGQLHAAHFKALPDDCIFINAARGECIVEQDLVEELQQCRLMAFLDVSAPEPAAVDSPLRTLPNVVYTSHIAGPATTAMGSLAVNDVDAFIRGESPRDVITR